jgi:hypothetical protein
MIAVPAGVKVLIAAKPVDFRKGGDGLAALVREALGEDQARDPGVLGAIAGWSMEWQRLDCPPVRTSSGTQKMQLISAMSCPRTAARAR